MSAAVLYWISRSAGKSALKRIALLMPIQMVLRSAPTVLLAEPLPEDDTEALEALETLTWAALERTSFARGYTLAYMRICEALDRKCISDTSQRKTA